jgi:hypothetical protein
MNGYDYIVAKQTAWATQSGISLIGSKNERGRRAYTPTLAQNLFHPLLSTVQKSFADGDGGELGASKFPGKMQAVHSSSALGVNVFQYWIEQHAVNIIASLCGLCRSDSTTPEDICFEVKHPISEAFGYHPNIDVVIHNSSSARIERFGIECKFSEAYGAYKHSGLKPKYLDLDDVWKGIPHLLSFARTISPNDDEFHHLHPAQLVKHILGLKKQCGSDGFRLLYLWYDVLGEEGARHRCEVQRFANIAKQDGIRFHSMTYQELIVRMQKNLSDEHTEYINYLTSRYL